MTGGQARRARTAPSRAAVLLRRPTWPGTLEHPSAPQRLGVSYDTAWARRPGVRVARTALFDCLTRPLTHLLLDPELIGAEHLDPVPAPAIFAANHASHLDTGLLVSVLPERFRHKMVVAAAADYFFDRRWKAVLSAGVLGSIPMERVKVSRSSADLAAELLQEGWSLVIFPEGGRTPDGWGQEFKGGAAYLASRCRVPVVPVHLQGTRAILGKGSTTFRPGPTAIRFGQPVDPGEGDRREDARRIAARIEQAIATLADEAETNWWQAALRAGSATTPSRRGPEVAPWRRAWMLPQSARSNTDRANTASTAHERRPKWPRST